MLYYEDIDECNSISIKYRPIKMPWPLSPRDLFYVQTLSMRGETLTGWCNSLQNSKVPERKGFVRVSMKNQGYVALPVFGSHKMKNAGRTQPDPTKLRKFSLDILVNFNLDFLAGVFGQQAIYRFMTSPHQTAYHWRYRQAEMNRKASVSLVEAVDFQHDSFDAASGKSNAVNVVTMPLEATDPLEVRGEGKA